MKKYLFPIGCIFIISFSSCTKNYSCYCINELSMAAQTPSQSYTVSAKKRSEADSKCNDIKEQNSQWTSCNARRK